MKKISSRILIVVFTITMMTSLVIGGFIYVNSIEYIKEETDNKLRCMSANFALTYSRNFTDVETIINVIGSQISTSFEPDKLKNNPGYLAAYEDETDDFIRDIAEHNTGFESVYLTFDSALTNEFREIWYLVLEEGGRPKRVDNDTYNSFRDTPMTGDDFYPNISQFTPENPAMVFYFDTVARGVGSWFEPEQEWGLPPTFISYTKPVYTDGRLIAVAGIDINVENLREKIENIDFIRGGRAFLLNDDLEVIIHPDYPEYTSLKEKEPETWRLIRPFAETSARNATEIYNGEQYKYACSRLSNGWILVLALHRDEIMQPLDQLASSILIIALLITGLSFLAANAFSGFISAPVTAAAEQLRHLEIGDYSLKIPPGLLKREDELGTLVKSVDTVSDLISREVERRRQTDAALTYQSRLAKTGEMLAHIAHQWRQPLNNLSLILSNSKEELSDPVFCRKEAEDNIAKCLMILKSMSGTIDDFRYFLSPDKRMEVFRLGSSISFAVEMMEDNLKSSNIKIIDQIDASARLYGAANEFTQVVSNILYNSRDALAETERTDRIIRLSYIKTGNLNIITFFNNGPEIPADVLENIFRPYYSTRKNDGGTGIGLYMSKLIIEEHFNGTISIENTGDGVACSLRIPGMMKEEYPNE